MREVAEERDDSGSEVAAFGVSAVERQLEVRHDLQASSTATNAVAPFPPQLHDVACDR
ncbi:hypothetical protein DFR72_107217 [Lentzea flaviverrucosa]|uniref:Uncharacterized protein n=1 Tax=Lentzea flaviverrucosa TaxID=200379 RepID=A0A1H9JNF5_9PSEU|nr:hypothetical protein DFR72_107217 [Lentzea flaviverrucosa]SEQ88309.1 hypothetical protein SAMN05216195_103310 [Lentzea flaviverrucosa]